MQPLRSGFLRPDRRGVLAWMPGALAAGRPFGIKVLSVVDDPGELGVDSHQGGVMIFDPATGAPLALLEAGAITAVRTAAVSALATDRLARRDASTLAILGAGTQARSHIEAMLEVRRIERVRVWSRDAEKTRLFAAEQAARHGLSVEAAADVATASQRRRHRLHHDIGQRAGALRSHDGGGDARQRGRRVDPVVA